jgi:hypothetical protein
MSLSFLLANWKPIAFALALVAAFGAGWTVNTWKHEADRAAALEALKEKQEENWAEAVQKEAERIAGQAERERETETVIEEVIRYVEADSGHCRIGPDSVRSLNRLRQ